MSTLRQLYCFFKPYRLRIILAILGTGAFTLLGLMPPLLMRFLVDRVAKPRAWQLLLPVVVLIVMVPLLSEIIRFVNVLAIMRTGQRIIADIRLAMYRKVLRLSLRYHSRHSAGATVSRLMDDVNMVLRLLTGETVRMVVDLLVLIFSLTIAFSISAFLGFILCTILCLYVMAYRLFSRRIRGATQSYRRTHDQIAGRLQETVAGVRQVRIYNREGWENEMFRDRAAESADRAMATSMGTVNLSTACAAISGFGSTLIYGVAGYMVLVGQISYGDMLAFDAYVWMTVTPVVRLTNLAGQLVETFVSVERIGEVLGAGIDVKSVPGAPPLPDGPGQVEFRNVCFAYDEGQPLYNDLNLTVAPGSSVALVGPTGCGKTTLMALLMRYWDVQKGQVLVDGADIKTVQLNSLRDVFGVVLQDPVVFDGTLAENIAYGRPAAPREDIERVARTAEIYDMAMKLPEGFDTVIGTRGVKLSLGEKQRVSIARAILKNPRILVMDEATSALDSQSEALIQRAMTHVLRGRTSFVVAHRLSTITASDLIVVMKAGRIVQKGTHEELIQAGGLYQKLYEQLRGEPERRVRA